MDPSLPSTHSESAVHDPKSELSVAGRRTRPAITHFAVLASVILPLTFVPYLLARRKVSALSQRVNILETSLKSIHTKELLRLTKLETSLQVIQRDLRFMMNENTSLKDDQRHTRSLIHDIMMEAEELHLQTQDAAASQKAAMDTTQSDLQRLLEEARNARAQGEAIRALGPSLADVAAFMHEVELFMPVTSKSREKDRVEELRSVAFRLQNLPRQPCQARPQ